MKKVTVLFAISLFVFLPQVQAQTMMLHYGTDTLRVSMADLDSLTFSGSGPLSPTNVDLNINPTAIEGGGGTWNLEVAALLTDVNGNPVGNGIPVQFSIEPVGVAMISNGVTGNPSPLGPSSDGYAYSTLAYGSRHTNETVTITATCFVPGGTLDATYELSLPVQQPYGILSANPTNYVFDETNPINCSIDLTTYIQDGHNSLIEGQMVHYSTQFGDVYATSTPGGNPDPYAVTDEDGVATRWFIATADDVFPDPASPMNNCTIEVEIVGTDISLEPVIIFFYR